MCNFLGSIDDALKNINIFPSPGGVKFITQYTLWNGDHIPTSSYFYYVVDGEFILTVEDKNYIVRPHQLALLPRGRRHTYVLSPLKKLSLWLCPLIAEVEGEDFFERFGFAEDNHVVDIEKHDELVSLFYDASHSTDYENELSLRLNCAAKTTSIIAMYVDAHIKQMPTDTHEFESIVNYMHEHLGEKISLSFLAESMHMLSLIHI